MISIGLSLVGITIFHDIPKMFTKGYLVIDHWQIGDILRPLLIVIGLLFVATKYLSIQNRTFREGLAKLRPKYLSILRGTFKKDIPGLDEVRWEIVEKIERSIRPRTRLLLYEDLYAVCLLLGVIRAEREEASIEIVRWLDEKGYPDRRKLGLLDERVRGLSRDDAAFFRFIQKVFLVPKRLSGPRWRIFSEVLRHEFHRVDDIPSYLAEFREEEISREGLVGTFTSMVVFCCLVGGGILERILPINLLGARNRLKG
jgi:hypothetical protein